MKALVIYGSERGGTAGLAAMIGTAFRDEGWIAEVRDAGTEGPIDGDVVVIGGALYLNRWHRAARQFTRRHARALAQVPVWLFSSGPLDDSARGGDLAAVPQVQAIAAQLEAHGHMTFGGRLEPTAKGLMARSMARKMSGDWRDSEHAAEWVHEICHAVSPPRTIVLPEATEAGQVQVPRQRQDMDQTVTT
jgi:menaquinone-dependent protoporphyrinogen oxidase